MLEQKIDILAKETLEQADAICFTSNGITKKNGALVMGAGVAKAFRDKFYNLDQSAGSQVKSNGNICQCVRMVHNGRTGKLHIIAFPTKNHWRNFSSLKLIEKSAKELMDLVEEHEWEQVYLPRPGVGFGGLKWDTQVKPVLEKILDDRVIVCYK